jgi:hypothetical protein
LTHEASRRARTPDVWASAPPALSQLQRATDFPILVSDAPVLPGLRNPLERGESGYQVGSYMFNIIAAELLFAILFVLVLVVTWPDPPWNLLQYGGIALMVLAPFLFYPFSKTLFLAFDLLFRPPTPEELS